MVVIKVCGFIHNKDRLMTQDLLDIWRVRIRQGTLRWFRSCGNNRRQAVNWEGLVSVHYPWQEHKVEKRRLYCDHCPRGLTTATVDRDQQLQHTVRWPVPVSQSLLDLKSLTSPAWTQMSMFNHCGNASGISHSKNLENTVAVKT